MELNDTNNTTSVTHDVAKKFALECFEAVGISPEHAAVCAGGLVEADLCGVDTHGIQRLPIYIGRLQKGLINDSPNIVINRVTPACARVDGDDGLGFVVAREAMAESIEMTNRSGFSTCGVFRSTHFGMARLYIEQAVGEGLIGIVMTNASPSLPPWGGRTPILGTSPLAIGVPGPATEKHFLLDMAPSVAARGKIRKAMRAGDSIPAGWALDGDGNETTDPSKALEGVVLPIGGPKGSGIAMALDILCGVITGAGFGGGVGDQFSMFDRPQNVGHFMITIKPDLFIDSQTFHLRMEEWVKTIQNVEKANGVDKIYLPGQIESETRAERLHLGIKYLSSDIRALNELGHSLGVGSLKELV
jgi:LDH2 family malate/lactate/ureidoglycolate dehydrogenase